MKGPSKEGNINHSVEFENFTSRTVDLPHEHPLYVIQASQGDFGIAGLNL